MALNIDIGDGQDALSQNQYIEALDGTYWIDGWDATLGTGDLEVDVAAGSGAISGDDVSTGATQTVDFTGDVDGTEPRKAVISVDDTGIVRKTVGETSPPKPVGELRFRTYDPAPPTDVPGVVVAEVWLDAGIANLVSDDVRDRRVSNHAAQLISRQFTKTDSAETFEEADVTVTSDKTEVSNQSVQFAPQVGTTASRPDDDSTLNYSRSTGLQIVPNKDIDAVDVTLSGNQGLVQDVFITDTGYNLLDESTDGHAAGDTVRLEADLTAGSTYYVGVWNDGADYTAGVRITGGPFTSTDVDIKADGVQFIHPDNSGVQTNSRNYAIRDVTAIEYPNTGSATVELPNPPNVERWDAATYQISPDGETVEVYVEESTDGGTTWDEIQGPINRGDQIDAPPSAAVRFRVEFSRQDASNNPILDAIYLRYEV